MYTGELIFLIRWLSLQYLNIHVNTHLNHLNDLVNIFVNDSKRRFNYDDVHVKITSVYVKTVYLNSI